MNEESVWLVAPSATYVEWQKREAAGADRRPFSERSITQHIAMFDRFLRFITAQHATVATFDAGHLERFQADIDANSAPGTTTRLRYVKLVDRLCRHLVETGVRTSNPASSFVRAEAWPVDEPEPVFLDADADARLQAHLASSEPADERERRSLAVVALLLGTGISAAEIRGSLRSHLVIDSVRPHIFIPKRGPRDERKVSLPAFALPSLARWLRIRESAGQDAFLFPAPNGKGTINDMMLGLIVRQALERIDYKAPDMSPRVLRNTYARRQLLAGRTNEDVSRLLGLVSQRTVTRLRATIQAGAVAT